MKTVVGSITASFAKLGRCCGKLLTPTMNQLSSKQYPRRDLVGGVYTSADFIKAGLPADPEIHTRVSSDGKVMWFWRTTISGWVLGTAVCLKKEGFDEWLYSGPSRRSSVLRMPLKPGEGDTILLPTVAAGRVGHRCQDQLHVGAV